MIIDVKTMNYREINEALHAASEPLTLTGCLGQRFIAAGMDAGQITLCGTPGNALGAYLDGACIEIRGNAQDAVGDTMNSGSIVVHGSIGDAAGYAMRGGEIYVRDNAGYRAGVHMKAYKEKLPVMVIGGRAGSFLGEYQAGGIIVVLGLNTDGKRIVSNFPCTGMHGGKLFLRSDCADITFPAQVSTRRATQEDLQELRKYVERYCALFARDADELMRGPFTVVTPNSSNPFKLMYVAN